MYTKDRPLRIGTRGSPLAIVQAEAVRDALVTCGAVAARGCDITIIGTTGDRVQDRALAEIGGKALWTKELDHALLAAGIDIAVHSAKDIESLRPAEIALAATLPRADPRDCLIGLSGLDALRPGMMIGTTSPRRAAQLRRRCPGVEITLFRGNVATRLKRLGAGEANATLLAKAGLDRLNLAPGAPIAASEMLPAPGQAAIAIECRAGDAATLELLDAINDSTTWLAVRAERHFAAALGGTCHSPVAALAERAADARGDFVLRGEILAEDGTECVSGVHAFAADAAAARAAGRDLAAQLLANSSAALRAQFAGR